MSDTSVGAPCEATLERLAEAELVSPTAVRFVEFLRRHAPATDPNVLLAAALAAHAPAQGSVSFDLATSGGRLRAMEGDTEGNVFTLPALAAWRDAIVSSGLASLAGRDEPGALPLVLDGNRLYLLRFWIAEGLVAKAIRARANLPTSTVDGRRVGKVRRVIEKLFPESPGQERPDWQRIAAAHAVVSPLTVITGGPGTGKTTVVVRILTLVQQIDDPAPRVLMLAPTGKAAARMREALNQARSARSGLHPAADIEPMTIHRALGLHPMNPSRPRHTAENPLPADIVVVDEASMIDLPLFAQLLDAVSLHARLILVGDPLQLAAVGAGSVLADLVADAVGYSVDRLRSLDSLVPDDVARIEATRSLAGLADSFVRLERSHRFAGQERILAFAQALGAGNEMRLRDLLGEAGRSPTEGFHFIELGEGSELPAVARACLERAVSRYAAVSSAAEVKAANQAFRVLVPFRRGDLGVTEINELGREIAIRNDPSARGTWYHGRPVIITQNDPETRLANGDLGLAINMDVAGTNKIRLVFPDSRVAGNELAPVACPSHDSVYALTVHKSQGSEFDEVMVIVPRARAELVTRQLLYTAITRARHRLVLVANSDDLIAAALRDDRRTSGLRDRVWGGR